MKLTLAILVLFGLSTTWGLPAWFWEDHEKEDVQRRLLNLFSVPDFTGKLMRWKTGISLPSRKSYSLSIFFYPSGSYMEKLIDDGIEKDIVGRKGMKYGLVLLDLLLQMEDEGTI